MSQTKLKTRFSEFLPVRFTVFFYKETGWKAAWSFVLQLLVSLLGGVGLLMLIPFLYVIGVSEDQADSQIMRIAVRAVESVGLDLTLTSGLIIFVAIIGLHGILRYWQSILQTVISEEFTRVLRDQVYEAMARARWSVVASMRASTIHHTIHGDVPTISAATRGVQGILSTVLMFAVNIAIAGYISIPATLITLASGALTVVILKPLTNRVRASGERRHASWRGIYNAVSDHVSGLKVSKSYGLEGEYVTRFQKLGTELIAASLNYTRTSQIGRFFQQLAAAIALSAFVYIGVEVLDLPLPELILLILLFSRLFPQFSSLLTSWHRLVHEMPSFVAYETVRNTLESGQEKRSEVPVEPIAIHDSVQFENVSFTYESVDYPALQEINIQIRPNTMTAVVGPSGAGKTTLADMLIGLLRPSEGRISIDGSELSDDNMEAWRASVGYVPQEVFLFHDTIRANILWGKPSASEEDIWTALEMASASQFVKTLKQGLDTIVGDRGIRLSGGERQRIALARALIRKPTLLLLDEATSALDADNESRIQEAIDRLHGELTLVVIAHRLSTIRNSDNVVVLNEGRVVEQGSREELWANPESIFRFMTGINSLEAPANESHSNDAKSEAIWGDESETGSFLS